MKQPQSQRKQTMRHNTYKPIHQVRDPQPIRATCFHPSGEAYVVGTNSKALKICLYPGSGQRQELLECDGLLVEPEVSFTCLHIHCASVYCATFSPKGNLLATGSNDQVVHVIKYNSSKHAPEGSEYKLSMHSGTVRDVCFLHGDDEDDESAQLLSAGAGSFEIHLTDCNVMKPSQTFPGHESAVMSLDSCNGSPNLFVSGSLDGTIKFWDTRVNSATSTITGKTRMQSDTTLDGDTSFDEPCPQKVSQDVSLTSWQDDKRQAGADNQDDQENNESREEIFETPRHPGNDRQPPRATTGVPVGVVRLDPSGRLLVSGHQDGSCMLYDVRAGRVIQLFQAHESEIRTIDFSPNAYYILTGGYDGLVKLTDLQGKLTSPLPCVEVAELDDKVVQVAWHPHDYNFVTTCANGSATLWTIPDFDEWRDSTVMDTSVII